MKNSNKNLLETLSYVALIIIALLVFVHRLLPVVGVSVNGPLFNVLDTIQNFLILLVVGILAHSFAYSSSNKVVRILFWSAIIVFIVGTVLVWF